MEQKKRIALVAHDNKKRDLLEWAEFNKSLLARHELYATGTTGKLLEQQLGVEVHKLQSGPLGGDQQIGAKSPKQELALLLSFWDRLPQQPKDTDGKALFLIAVVWTFLVPCTRQ